MGGVAVALCNCILEVRGSNLGQETAILRLIVVFLSPSRIIPE
jgi:hypothetical protein